jgi:hypothetical protein
MKYLFTILLLSSIVVKGQTDSSKNLRPVDLFEIKYAGVKESDRNMFLTREDLEAIEMRMTQFYYNKDQVSQSRVVYGILTLYDEYSKQPKDSITVFAGCPDRILGCLVHHGNKKQAVEPTFEKFIEYLRKK